MSGKKTLHYTLGLVLFLLLLAGCGGPSGPSESDCAVCDAYQHLVDVWPSNGEEVDAAGGSAVEIYAAITDAGEALVMAGEAADTTELGEVARQVGEAAASYVDRNPDVIDIGFIVFFTEDLVGGGELSQLCEGIGEPVTLP